MMSTLKDAVELCRIIEEVAPDFGAHVALTGGTLYKDSDRKDIDILFYRIRQAPVIDIKGLLKKLETIGFVMGKQFNWVQKATFHGHAIDFFFPENFPDPAGANYGLADYV